MSDDDPDPGDPPDPPSGSEVPSDTRPADGRRTPRLRATLEVRSSVERGPPRMPGPEPPPFFWHDVVHDPLPPQRVRGEGEVVLYHAMEVDPEVRLTYTTRVALYPVEDEEAATGDGSRSSLPTDHEMHGDHRLVVDSRVNVQKRILLEAMDRARRGADAFVVRQRQRLNERLSAKRGRAESHRSPLARRVAKGWLDLRARVVRGALDGFRDVVHAAVEVPDRVAGAALRAQAVLHTRLGRRTFWESVKDPRSLSLQERSVMVFLVALLSGVAVLLLNSVFALGFPRYAPVYRRVLADAGVMVLGVLFLPVVEEPLLVLSVLDVGPAAAFTGFMVGKLVGVWIMYLLGCSLHEAVADRVEGRPRLARGVDWLQGHADRYGLPVLVAGNALPFVAGLVLYPLAVAGMRFRDWMGGIAVGTALRYLAIIAAVVLIGPDRVAAWLADPLGALGFG